MFNIQVTSYMYVCTQVLYIMVWPGGLHVGLCATKLPVYLPNLMADRCRSIVLLNYLKCSKTRAVICFNLIDSVQYVNLSRLTRFVYATTFIFYEVRP